MKKKRSLGTIVLSKDFAALVMRYIYALSKGKKKIRKAALAKAYMLGHRKKAVR